MEASHRPYSITKVGYKFSLAFHGINLLAGAKRNRLIRFMVVNRISPFSCEWVRSNVRIG